MEDYLSLTDKLRGMEQEFGPGYGKNVRRQGMVAVRRVTSLYLSEPENYDRPTDEFVDDVFVNFRDFLSKAKR